MSTSIEDRLRDDADAGEARWALPQAQSYPLPSQAWREVNEKDRSEKRDVRWELVAAGLVGMVVALVGVRMADRRG